LEKVAILQVFIFHGWKVVRKAKKSWGAGPILEGKLIVQTFTFDCKKACNKPEQRILIFHNKEDQGKTTNLRGKKREQGEEKKDFTRNLFGRKIPSP